MKVGDWVRVIEGSWKGNEGEIFITNNRFSWVRLLDGEEALCFPHELESLPVLGQTSIRSEA